MKVFVLFSAALVLFTYQSLPAQTVEVLKVSMSKKVPEKAESIVFGSFNSEAGTVATLLIHPAEGSSVVAVLEDGHEITGVTDEKGNAVKDMEAVFKDFGSKAADDGSCGVVEVEIPLAGEDGPAQVIVTGTLSVQIAKGTKESKTDAIDDLIGKELKVGEETCELQSLTRESDGVGFSLKFKKRADFIKQVIVLDGDKEVPAESRGWSRSGFGDEVEEQRDYAAPTKGKGLKLKFILHDEVKTEPLEFKVTLPAKF